MLAVPVGLLAAAILVVNNIRDLETDRRAGKRTLAVRLGRERARDAVRAAMLARLRDRAAAVGARRPLAVAAAAVAGAAARRAAGAASCATRADGPSLNGALARTGMLQLVFCVLLSRGLLSRADTARRVALGPLRAARAAADAWGELRERELLRVRLRWPDGLRRGRGGAAGALRRRLARRGARRARRLRGASLRAPATPTRRRARRLRGRARLPQALAGGRPRAVGSRVAAARGAARLRAPRCGRPRRGRRSTRRSAPRTARRRRGRGGRGARGLPLREGEGRRRRRRRARGRRPRGGRARRWRCASTPTAHGAAEEAVAQPARARARRARARRGAGARRRRRCARCAARRRCRSRWTRRPPSPARRVGRRRRRVPEGRALRRDLRRCCARPRSARAAGSEVYVASTFDGPLGHRGGGCTPRPRCARTARCRLRAGDAGAFEGLDGRCRAASAGAIRVPARARASPGLGPTLRLLGRSSAPGVASLLRVRSGSATASGASSWTAWPAAATTCSSASGRARPSARRARGTSRRARRRSARPGIRSSPRRSHSGSIAPVPMPRSAAARPGAVLRSRSAWAAPRPRRLAGEQRLGRPRARERLDAARSSPSASAVVGRAARRALAASAMPGRGADEHEPLDRAAPARAPRPARRGRPSSSRRA